MLLKDKNKLKKGKHGSYTALVKRYSFTAATCELYLLLATNVMDTESAM
jgi:hypothetical protein